MEADRLIKITGFSSALCGFALRRLDVNAPAAGAQSNEPAGAVDGALETTCGDSHNRISFVSEGGHGIDLCSMMGRNPRSH
jgi:hypothetical protein